MKHINIFNFTLLVTMLLYFNFHAFGHSPCQSEQQARDNAQYRLDAAESWVTYYETEINLL